MAQHQYSNRGGTSPYNQNIPPKKADFPLDTKTLGGWVKNGIDETTISFADEFGKFVADKELTTSQIRIAFGEMRRIQINGYIAEKTDFILLKPKLAYAVKRHKKEGLTKFYDFFSIAYEAVDKKNDENGEKHFQNLMNIMEAVLAYHKYHGGKE